MNETLSTTLRSRRVLITCGTGGVGKTSLSCMLAIRQALWGSATAVITVDPAKRLRTALGVETLGDDPTDLTDRLLAAGASPNTGRFAAIVPDTRKTFETFVRELAPNERVFRRIVDNPIFQLFAREFSGSNEYMALERLLALSESGAFEKIVLDTPPSRNTLAFLEAPRLLSRFFEEGFIRWLVVPTNRLVAGGIKKALGLLESLTGEGFMTDLLRFATDLFEVQAKFTANLGRITTMLKSEDVGFVMVTQPQPEIIAEARLFMQTIQDHGFHFEGLILNRCLSGLEFAPPSPNEDPGVTLLRKHVERELDVIRELERARVPVLAKIPELPRDVNRLEDLIDVSSRLAD